MLLLQSGPLCGCPWQAFGWVAVLTNSYIVSALGALFAPTLLAKSFWIFVSFATTVLTMYETFLVVWKQPSKQHRYIAILNAVFVVYGILYLLAVFGRISPLTEIVCFGLCDIFSKATFSSFMFNASLSEMYHDLLLSKRYADDIVEKSVAPMFVLRCEDGAITRQNSIGTRLGLQDHPSF